MRVMKSCRHDGSINSISTSHTKSHGTFTKPVTSGLYRTRRSAAASLSSAAMLAAAESGFSWL